MTLTVLITGASQGIGAATARLFASKGYNVVLAARPSDYLDNMEQEIINSGGEALAVPCDMTQYDQVKNLVEKSLSRFQNIDVLINNAGICMNALMVDTTLEDWRKIIDLNLWGYIYTINLLLPHFLERKQGTIVNVNSIGGLVPMPRMTAYCTTKHAITGLTETLRLELEPQGIRVCGVYPSATKSSFLDRAIFKGDEKQDAQAYKESFAKLLESPIASQNIDVAKAIYKAVEQQQAQVVVGSGNFVTGLHRLLPGVTNRLMQRAVKS